MLWKTRKHDRPQTSKDRGASGGHATSGLPGIHHARPRSPALFSRLVFCLSPYLASLALAPLAPFSRTPTYVQEAVMSEPGVISCHPSCGCLDQAVCCSFPRKLIEGVYW